MGGKGLNSELREPGNTTFPYICFKLKIVHHPSKPCNTPL